MGLFCANIILSKPVHEQALEHLREAGLKAFVAQDVAITVVAEQRIEEQDASWLYELTSELSRQCRCAALGAIIHDSDILMLALAENGLVIDSYNSCPGYFEEQATDADLLPAGGAPLALAEAFGAESNVTALAEILSTGAPGSADDNAYAFEDDRYVDLCEALGLPKWAAFFCYSAAERHEWPDGLDAGNVRAV